MSFSCLQDNSIFAWLINCLKAEFWFSEGHSQKLICVAEALPLGDASVDAVVATLVLCSVKDVDLALQVSENQRLLLQPWIRDLKCSICLEFRWQGSFDFDAQS
ncbi:uncharacterized protein [Coffea arabica]|uniref:Uncharacterized protein isoform X3 n=1 Tax=Coffea arabica TaxID=13443 RepID=A0ABM4UVF8_COFAR